MAVCEIDLWGGATSKSRSGLGIESSSDCSRFSAAFRVISLSKGLGDIKFVISITKVTAPTNNIISCEKKGVADSSNEAYKQSIRDGSL